MRKPFDNVRYLGSHWDKATYNQASGSLGNHGFGDDFVADPTTDPTAADMYAVEDTTALAVADVVPVVDVAPVATDSSPSLWSQLTSYVTQNAPSLLQQAQTALQKSSGSTAPVTTVKAGVATPVLTPAQVAAKATQSKYLLIGGGVALLAGILIFIKKRKK
jgi:LPXTG-motif cell wall-anchored protein